ncbi:retinol dehydrogenase 12-like isoform X1 [Varroa jacobsoni]|uniref:retinol dehydrogenase 12-like isoform X1 n=1 Tax=Varroa jacobsoni TaxID=62625 RepID=UPI000BF5E3A4|nr:retinol dehydrogenase 12-like isoform X1 [Varroa jacobsoni]XP_022701690.1 retinol dehydrogenase 12-like isoform X1 [Varroa jacobsoni]
MWLYIAFFVLAGIIVLALIIRSVIRTTVYYDQIPDLNGKTIVVTGASSGLGLHLTETLVKHGARVITINRHLDDINFVQHFASEIVRTENRIDCLVNNAGILCDPEFSTDGVDRMMAVNFVGHFQLTRLLLPKMRASEHGLGRVVNITCGRFAEGDLHLLFDMQRMELKSGTSYKIRDWYYASKLGLYLMSRELCRRYKSNELCSICVDPGLLSTSFYTRLPQPHRSVWCLLAMLMFRSPEDGIQSVLFALFDEKVQSCSGMMIKDCKIYDPADAEFLRRTRSVNMSERVWDVTEQLIEDKLDKVVRSIQQARIRRVEKKIDYVRFN